MSDFLPPPRSEMKKPEENPKYREPRRLDFFWGAGLGLLLFLLSVGLSYACVSPLPFVVGFVVACMCLGRDYRSIFIGFIICVGLALLSVVIYCANHPLNI